MGFGRCTGVLTARKKLQTSIFYLRYLFTSNDDIQPSTVVSNQLPCGLVF